MTQVEGDLHQSGMRATQDQGKKGHRAGWSPNNAVPGPNGESQVARTAWDRAAAMWGRSREGAIRGSQGELSSLPISDSLTVLFLAPDLQAQVPVTL